MRKAEHGWAEKIERAKEARRQGAWLRRYLAAQREPVESPIDFSLAKPVTRMRQEPRRLKENR